MLEPASRSSTVVGVGVPKQLGLDLGFQDGTRQLGHRARGVRHSIRVRQCGIGHTGRPTSSVPFSGDIEAGWVEFDESPLAAQQLLEVENDLIASYFLRTGELPAAQFLG